MMKEHLVKKRITIFLLLMLIAVVVLVIRLGYVSFYMSKTVNPKAYALWTREVPIEGKRGNIYDRNGKLIVGNSLAPSVAAINRQVKDKEATATFLSEVLEVPYEKILAHLKKNVSVELIKPEGRKISTETAKKIIAANLDGIYVVGDTVRYYPYENTLSQVLGFTGIDNQGIAGLEYVYDQYLKGMNGALNIYTDAKGNLMPDMVSYYQSASQGFDLYLTIDLDVQLIVERVMREAVARYSPDQMLVMVQHPKTGETLAMASYPNFHPGYYQDYPQEIYNRNLPIWMSYEPGSTFKIITYSAGLEEKVFSLNEGFYDPGYRMVGNVRIKDWKAGGHGQQTFLEVLQNSCNPGFMEIGFRLGTDRLFSYIENYGFGQKTGIDLLGEGKGIVFKKERVGPVELATSSFGQGNSVTPLQLVTAASAAVNGGNLMTPYILKQMTMSTTKEIVLEQKPTVKRRVISEETSKLTAYALEHVVAKGTGRGAYTHGYRVGGKTGTAQKVGENGQYLENNYILSFLGIAPANDPEVTIYLAIDNPKNTIQYGGVVAAPLVGEILQEILPVLGVKKQTDTQIQKDYRYYIDKFYYEIPNYVGMEKSKIALPYHYKLEFLGHGTKVVDQEPKAKEHVMEGGTVILYLK